VSSCYFHILSRLWYKKCFLFASAVLHLVLNYCFFFIFVVLEMLFEVNLYRNQVNKAQNLQTYILELLEKWIEPRSGFLKQRYIPQTIKLGKVVYHELTNTNEVIRFRFSSLKNCISWRHKPCSSPESLCYWGILIPNTFQNSPSHKGSMKPAL
jgi:hypothetical protein